MVKFRNKVIATMLVVPCVIIVSCAAVICCNFHPGRIYEIPGSSRLFAQAVDSADDALHVKAADWPYTFWRPFLLGDAAWPERYSVARFFRSKDGSVVALLAQERDAPGPLYITAYDFKNHEKFAAKNAEGGAFDNHAKVVDLLGQRGGPEESPIEIPPLNSGLYEK